MLTGSVLRRDGNIPSYCIKEETHTMATVKELRERAGWNQVDLAVKAGLSVGTISRIENGHKPNRGTLKLIAHALGVDVSEITTARTEESAQ